MALDGELNREVALKQILDHHADDPTSRQRFLLEAEVTGGLEHPGIVPVYGLGTYGDGRPYYAMRFIRGDSLKEAIDHFHADETLKKDPGRRSLELRKLLRRFMDVCNAIDYATAEACCTATSSRAISSSVSMARRWWSIGAWPRPPARPTQALGGATLMPTSASGSAETLPGSALGTPAYMSPEQARGDLDVLGPRSDVYSLGATLYCLLTGKPPQEGDDLGEILRRVQRGEFTPPRQVDSSIDPALEAICLKAMALKPDDRYATPRLWPRTSSAGWPTSPSPPIATRFRSGCPAGCVDTGPAWRSGPGHSRRQWSCWRSAPVLLGQSRVKIERERKRAEAVNAFLVKDLLTQADPEENQAGEKLTVRELLDKAAKACDASASMNQNPDVEGTIRVRDRQHYYGLGLYPEAKTQLERAVVCQDQVKDYPPLKPSSPQSTCLGDLNKGGDREKALRLADGLLKRAKATLGPDHEETIYAADSLATMTLPNGEAFTIFRENLETQKRLRAGTPADAPRDSSTWPLDSPDTSPVTCRKTSRKACRSINRRATPSSAGLGPDHPETLREELGLGFRLARSGKFAEAREVLAPLRGSELLRWSGPDHLFPLGCSSSWRWRKRG